MTDYADIIQPHKGLPARITLGDGQKPSTFDIVVHVASNVRNSDSVSFQVAFETKNGMRYSYRQPYARNGEYGFQILTAQTVGKIWLETIKGRSSVVVPKCDSATIMFSLEDNL